VRADYAVAKLIEGDFKNMQVNAVVRKAAAAKQDEQPARELTPGSSDKPMQWN